MRQTVRPIDYQPQPPPHNSLTPRASMRAVIAMTDMLHPITLTGNHVQLVPLQVEHADGLARAAEDGELWRLWYTNVPHPDQMLEEIQRRLTLQAIVKASAERGCAPGGSRQRGQHCDRPQREHERHVARCHFYCW